MVQKRFLAGTCHAILKAAGIKKQKYGGNKDD